MTALRESYNKFLLDLDNELIELGDLKGDWDKAVNGEALIEVKGEFYVEGNLITHMTKDVLIANGYHYQHSCIPIEELIEIVENIWE